MADTRFPTALHIVVTVAVNEAAGVRTTSPVLAEALNTNASFVRKLVSTLTKAGILASKDGSGGGIGLARKSEKIQLIEIYNAILPDQRSWAAREKIPSLCAVTRNIGTISDQLGEHADAAVARVLGGVSIADCVAKIAELETSAKTGS